MIQLDIVNWASITKVSIYTDEWYKKWVLEYILLTKKDRDRLRQFYCEVTRATFNELDFPYWRTNWRYPSTLPDDFEIVEICANIRLTAQYGFSHGTSTIVVLAPLDALDDQYDN